MGVSLRSLKMKYLAIAAALLAAAAIAAALMVRSSSDAKNGYSPVKVERGDITIEILSTGVVSPENRLEIKPPIAGRVEEVLVNEGEDVKKGQVLARMSSTERAALLDAASARGNEELKRWQEFYRAAPIMAPIDGMIIARNVEPGQSFTTADAVFVMSDRLTVKAQVDETDIADIKLGQRADIVLDAYPDHHMTSVVDKIAYDATTISNVTTYIVDVLPDETPEFMRSGMTANVRFLVTSNEGVLTLPAGAVSISEGKGTVLTPASGPMGQPVERRIEVGSSDGKLIEIKSGLSEGDIVLAPQSKRGAARSGGTASPFTPIRPGRSR